MFVLVILQNCALSKSNFIEVKESQYEDFYGTNLRKYWLCLPHLQLKPIDSSLIKDSNVSRTIQTTH